jgi:hypothetical protein
MAKYELYRDAAGKFICGKKEGERAALPLPVLVS